MLPAIQTFQKHGSIRYFMAPMAGISDVVFRLLMREMGAQIVVSELISAEGLSRGGKKSRDMLLYDERERPFGIQIFGHNKGSMVVAAKMVQDIGADFVDVNFGCPVKKVVCDGGGAAWLKEPSKMGELLSAMKAVLTVPLTIKVRTGWDNETRNVADIVRVAADSGVEWVAIHGRTRAQGYSGEADWDLIREVARNSPIPIVGNGDLVSAAKARERIEQGYAHAVMIGRGALKNPWIFQEILSGERAERNFLDFVERHFEIATEKRDRQRAFLSIKKFLAWYATGYPGCSMFRKRIFETHDIDALRGLSLDYFASIDRSLWNEDTTPFLMGGHG